MTTAAAATSTDPIAALWREARSWLADALHEFTGPIEIARTLARHARHAVKRRLVRLEAFVLKLLLVEATRLSGVTHTHALPSAISCAAEDRACVSLPSTAAEDAANPSTWRVRFRLRVPSEPRAAKPAPISTGPRIRDLGPALLVRDIWREAARRQLYDRLHPKFDAAAVHARAQARARRLARRFEALIRVITNPRRAIAALARRLAALGAKARAFARRIAQLAPRTGGGLMFGHASVACFDASLTLRDVDTS